MMCYSKQLDCVVGQLFNCWIVLILIGCRRFGDYLGTSSREEALIRGLFGGKLRPCHSACCLTLGVVCKNGQEEIFLVCKLLTFQWNK